MQKFSEINKINCVLIPGVQSSGVAAAPGNAVYETDTVNMEGYRKCTFIYAIGTAVATTVWDIVPMCGDLATTGTGSVTPITGYHYRTQGTTDTAYVDDIPGALTAGTSAGVTTTTGYVGGLVIFEIESPQVHDTASTAKYVKLYITSTTAADAPRGSCCIAILSEPRFQQAILDTVIS